MDERHVPPIGLRYWAVFVAASVFGAHMGDVVTAALRIGLLCQILVLAVALLLVFLVERHDRSSTDAYYWGAVIIMQVMAVRLADFAALQLGINRIELVGGLVLLLVTTIIVSRSDETHIFSTLQLERPGPAAKPLADVPHWLDLIVASVLGSAAADLVAITFGIGTVLSAVVLSALVIVLIYLQRRSRPARLHAFWLTTTVVRADGICLGDLLVKGPNLQLGLALSTVLSALLVIGLLVYWRAPKSPV